MGKILIIEDDQFTQDFIREILEEDGYKVVTALSGEEALSSEPIEKKY